MDEDKILRILRMLNRWWGAVCSYLLAAYLDACDRTVRYWLRKLEKQGLVYRPKRSKRKGWVAV